MNEQDNAPLESPSGDSDTPPPTVNPDHTDCKDMLYKSQATIAELRGRIDTLANEQISGDDYRLTDFWEKAQELATKANHCDVFDEMAEALGGPRRRKGYTVTLSITGYINIDVEAVDAEDAFEIAREMYRNGDCDNSFGDLEGIDEDWSNADIERNNY